jgi:hypothetical protein
MQVEATTDGGRRYNRILVQDYTFSLRGATVEREDLRLKLRHVAHLALTLVPNKHGSGVEELDVHGLAQHGR